MFTILIWIRMIWKKNQVSHFLHSMPLLYLPKNDEWEKFTYLLVIFFQTPK